MVFVHTAHHLFLRSLPTHTKIIVAFIFIATMITSCAMPSNPNYNRPLARNVIMQITKGMLEQDVRKILGSPAIIDNFHPNLLVYLFIEPTTKKPWQTLITMDEKRHVSKVESRTATINYQP